MTYLSSLNSRQREAVMHGDGPIVVLAGAGSGKTRVIVSRIARLILERGVAPESILAVTFTNKAAGEMRERVFSLLGENRRAGGRPPLVCTFHSFCVRLLRRHGAPLSNLRKGFGTDFLIFDRADQTAVVKEALKKGGATRLDLRPRKVLGSISRLKNRELGIGKLRGKDSLETRILNEVHQRYEAALLAANALDFDDLLLEAMRLLESFVAVRKELQVTYRHLLVDEFQDTNRPQYEILRLIAGKRPNVCVVGDDDQAIYSWRGARIDNLLGFEADFPGTKVVRLEQNYRSTQAILDASSAVVAQNVRRKEKRLWTSGPAGDRPVLRRLADADAEARFVAREAGRLLDADPEMRVAILYRTNAQSRLFEEQLRRDGREFLVVGGVAFYQRAEVKDVLAFLKAAVSPGDSVSLRRIINVPARGIGRSTLARLSQHAASEGLSLWEAIEQTVERNLQPPRARNALQRFRKLMLQLRQRTGQDGIEEVLEWVLDRTGYRTMLGSDDSPEAQARVENVNELLLAARDAGACGGSLEEFLDYAALVSDTDGLDEAARILLMTLHTAKGLEFPAVIMAGMEENLLPHSQSMGPGDDGIEEERRLCYVGMTRARRHLLLTCASYRRQYGAGDPLHMAPSRFLKEIPARLLDDRTPAAASGGLDTALGARDRALGGPSPGSRPRQNPVTVAGVRTHDSVTAVAGFFNAKGIELSPAPGPLPRRGAGPSSRPVRGAARLGQAKKALRKQGPFARGSRVRHDKFGVGVVQSREGDGPTAKLWVYFRGYGRKRLVAGYANLQELQQR